MSGSTLVSYKVQPNSQARQGHPSTVTDRNRAEGKEGQVSAEINDRIPEEDGGDG